MKRQSLSRDRGARRLLWLERSLASSRWPTNNSQVRQGGANVGGYGSGMWRVSRHPLAETMRRIDVETVHREEPSLTAHHRLQVRRHRSDGEVDVTIVCLEATRAPFGGQRLWFRCPRCDGRCR